MALILSIAAGIFAVVLVMVYVGQREASLLELSELQEVVVATTDILQNSVVDERVATVTRVPRKYVQPGAIAVLSEAVGRVAAVPIPNGSQVTGTALLEGGVESLAFDVPRGMRAITVAVNDVSGVAGLVRAGNFVDLLGTFEYGVPTGSVGGQITYTQEKTETFTLVQNVQVIAVGRQYSGAPADTSLREGETVEQAQQRRRQEAELAEIQNLTVLLTPPQAQEVVLAQQVGSLTFSLRSNLDAGQLTDLPRLDQLTLLRVPLPGGGTANPSVPLKSRPAPSWREMRGSRGF
jgi:pilus assembly protein CpaB